MSSEDLLGTLVTRIETGEQVPVEDVMKALASGPILDRRQANVHLANAYLKAGRQHEALCCAERAWFLGWRESGLAEFLIRGLSAAGRGRDTLDRIREFGTYAVRIGNRVLACNALMLFQQCALVAGVPPHDSILSDLIIGMLKQPRPPFRRRTGRLRVGYVLYGEAIANCILPSLIVNIIANHDRSRYEPVLFSFFPIEYILNANAAFSSILCQIQSIGVKLIANDDGSNLYEYALSLSRLIKSEEIDVLIPHGQHAPNFILAALGPAPLILGFDTGDPHSYSSQALDHIVAPSEDRDMMA